MHYEKVYCTCATRGGRWHVSTVPVGARKHAHSLPSPSLSPPNLTLATSIQIHQSHTEYISSCYTSMDSDQLKGRRSSSANLPSSFPPSQSKKPHASLANPSNLDRSSSQGSSQATAHISSDVQASGSASQGPMWFFSHPSEPSSRGLITGGSTNIHVDRSTYEQRGNFRAAPNYKAQRSADQPAIGSTDSMSPTSFGMDPVMNLGVGGFDLATGANIALTETQNFPDTYLKPFKDFNQVVATITKIHPYARITLGMLAAVSQMFVVQEIRNERLSRLLDTIKKVYEFLMEETTPKDMSGMRETFAKIALMTSGAVQFIKNYSATEDFWKRSGKDVEYETRDVSIAYTQALDDLMEQYRRRDDRGVGVDAFRVLEDLDLAGLARARGAGLNWTKRCIDGTRTDILTDIIDWIYDTDENVPRILWLHGQAGKGKSAIAHTVALWFENVGGVGSCFCFARDWQAEHLEEKIFRTIACDLAERDPAFRRALAGALATDDSLKTTSDVALQWRKLILEPLCKVSGRVVGNVVIVVDALDESGPERSRRDLVSVLASARAADLPRNVRILVTSRLFPDIEHALGAARHVRAASLDDVPAASEENDIRLYILKRLGHLRDVGPTEVFRIAQNAEGLFEWARLACEFVSLGRTVKNGLVKERIDNIMLLRSGGQLDALYRAILKDAIPNDRIALTRFRSVMQQIVSTVEPLSIDALSKMRSHFPANEDRYDVVAILESMAPLMSGITNRSSPVQPFHASFYDFLMDRSRSGVYFIDTSDAKDLAFATLQILCSDLQFNICRLESSYLANAEVSDLQKRIDENIPHHLSYCSRFWAQHLQKTAFDLELALLVNSIVGSEKILFWLEIISLLEVVGKGLDVLVTVKTWLHGQDGFKHTLAFIEDAIKLVQNFGSVIFHSTPHLYVSALPFIPPNTLLSKMLLPKFSGLAEVAVGVVKGWPVEQLLLHGHASIVNSVALSPDGKRIVSGSRDKTV
ncbi:hypothetical protein M404DRAFT_655279, partial [Pisolithus tinctorius Marx 270]